MHAQQTLILISIFFLFKAPKRLINVFFLGGGVNKLISIFNFPKFLTPPEPTQKTKFFMTAELGDVKRIKIKPIFPWAFAPPSFRAPGLDGRHRNREFEVK